MGAPHKDWVGGRVFLPFSGISCCFSFPSLLFVFIRIFFRIFFWQEEAKQAKVCMKV